MKKILNLWDYSKFVEFEDKVHVPRFVATGGWRVPRIQILEPNDVTNEEWHDF